MFIPNNRYTDIVVFENNNWVIKNRDIVVGELCHTCSNNIMSWYDLVSDEEQTDISVKYLSNTGEWCAGVIPIEMRPGA